MESTASAKLLKELRGWELIRNHHLTKNYAFSNYADGLKFVNRLSEIAEEQGHHPDIHLSWGKVRIEIWTHAIEGLTESDFILAAKIDQIDV